MLLPGHQGQSGTGRLTPLSLSDCVPGWMFVWVYLCVAVSVCAAVCSAGSPAGHAHRTSRHQCVPGALGTWLPGVPLAAAAPGGQVHGALPPDRHRPAGGDTLQRTGESSPPPVPPSQLSSLALAVLFITICSILLLMSTNTVEYKYSCGI